MMENFKWVVLIYKVPSNPTKYRATIWREIKRLGGVYLQDGVCIFPDVDDVPLNVSTLAERVKQMHGTEYMFYTDSVTTEQAHRLIEQFQEQRRTEYVVLIEKIEKLNEQVDSDVPSEANGEDWRETFKKLHKEYTLIKARDYFSQPLHAEAGKKLKHLHKRLLQDVKDGDSA